MPETALASKDPVCRWWAKYAPYVHIVGLVLLAAFTIGVYATKFDAHAETIKDHTLILADHEKRIGKAEDLEASNQRELVDMHEDLRTMMRYWNISQSGKHQ